MAPTPGADLGAGEGMSASSRAQAVEVGGVKARVLDAAARILATQGPDDLSLRAIAEAAGIGQASIYHYFAGKDELLLSLAVEGFEDLRRDILARQADPAVGSPMRGGHQAFFSLAETRPALFALMFNERLMARHEALREADRRAFLAYQDAVRADPRIPAGIKDQAALAIWALGRGIAAMMSSQPDGVLPDELATQLFTGAGWLIDHAPPAPFDAPAGET